MNADHLGGMLHPVAGRPSFEVAVIRQSAPGAEFRFNGIGMPPGRFEANGVTLKDLITFAYAVPDEKELIGGPNWMRTDRFDIKAKPDPADLPKLMALPPSKLHDQMRLRLQMLLEQRFKLQVSFAAKQLPLLALEVTKGGLRCKKIAAENAAFFDNPSPPPPPPPPPTIHHLPAPGHEGERDEIHWTSAGLPSPLILSWISAQSEVVGRTVIDKTGLQGEFNCEITWTRDPADTADSSFFTALREQMGLRLRPERGPVETLMVEKVDQPSAN